MAWQVSYRERKKGHERRSDEEGVGREKGREGGTEPEERKSFHESTTTILISTNNYVGKRSPSVNLSFSTVYIGQAPHV